ncbi:MAG: hypothetical protein SF182_22800 [Deltaproteobacteria bacterium]|nr:hypothetical protein [Deltaproteobacteria bacterium]
MSIDDLVKVVGIALGTTALDACPSADVDQSGDVEVNDAIVAVESALNGCPTADPATAALLLARGLAQLPRLSGVVAAGLNGLDEHPVCDLGGTVDSPCEDSGTGIRINHMRAEACRLNTSEGPLQLDGESTAKGPGMCPDVLFPSNITFDFGGTMVLQDEAGMALLSTELDTQIKLLRLIIGTPPCSIKGGEATINRTMTVHAVPAGHSLRLDFDQLGNLSEFVDFVGRCDLNQLRTTSNGGLTIADDYGARSLRLATTLHDMVVGVDVPNRTLQLDGLVESSCLGGEVRLRTLSPLDFHPERSCFTSGVLALGLPAGTVQVTIRADGGVETDTDADGIADASYPSCLELPR